MALPKPVQNPIPHLDRRQLQAEPSPGGGAGAGLDAPERHPPGMSIRTPNIGSLADLADKVTEIRQAATAAGHSEPIDVIYAYHVPSLATPSDNADVHREALAEMEKAGVTWVLVTPPTRTPAATFEFLEAFGSTYLT